LTRIRTLIAICAFALPVPVVVAGCGDDESNVDPQTVIDETFNNDERVTSGDLALTVSGSAEGEAGGSFEASLSGPFQGEEDNPNAIPQLDWTGSVSADGAGQSFSAEGGLVVTEDNAFVEYGGETYEVGTQTFSQFKQLAESAAAQQAENTENLSFSEAFRQQCESQIQAAGGDVAACEIDFENWLTDLTSEGTEDVEGAETDHVSGSLNVEAMVQDIVELGTAVPQAEAGGVPSEAQIQQATEAIEDASFDLYSGTDDRILRGLDFNIAVDPGVIPNAASAGIESADVSFSMRLGAVNEEQTIEAPADAQPIEELFGQFGVDPGALGGLGALGGAGDLGITPGQDAGGASVPGGGDTDAYLDCIGKAQTPEEIEACSQEL